MMRHDQRAGSPIAMDLPMTQGSKHHTDVMKRFSEGCWKSKSSSGNGGSQTPKSPISKAFDFFPWSKNKKNSEKIPSDIIRDDNHSKSVLRNDNTNRDVLTDKSNKSRSSKSDGLPKQSSAPLSRRTIKQLSRNKSLDMDELLDKVEDEDEGYHKKRNDNGKIKFLDDTFIDTIFRPVNRRPKSYNENMSPKMFHSEKHILFNDENVVYLIKKEKPIIYNQQNCLPQKGDSIHYRQEENNNTIFRDGSVIKARLKFKKLAPYNDDDDFDIRIQAIPKNSSSNYKSTASDVNESSKVNDNELNVDKWKLNKPRKKLSFREPVEFSRKSDKSDTKAGQQNNNGNRVENGEEGYNGEGYDSELESQAMRIVRTVGQAFEVCHKFNLQKNSLAYNDDTSDQSCDLLDNDRSSDRLSVEDEPKKDPIPLTPDPSPLQRPTYLDITPQTNFNCRKSPCSDGDKSPSTPLSTTKEVQQLKEQLEQQTLQTREALAQLMLVRERLLSETNARIEAQARTQQLLQQNRELLEHLASMGGYTETDRTGLTSASIGLAPQSQLQLLLQDQTVDMASPIRKAFLSTSNNNNLATINQQLNSLGSINQQLSTLSHQLTGLNQQSQNLQNFQNVGNIAYPSTPTSFPQFNQMQQINNNLASLGQPTNELRTQQELYHMNQELLNRLQNLNLNLTSPTTKSTNGQSLPNNNNTTNNGNNNTNNNNSPQSSYIFANPGHISTSSSNNNFNFLNSPSSLGNLTPSPIGTLNRNSYSNSPMDDNFGLSIDKNLNDIDDNQFIKPLSQVGTLTTLDADGKVKVVVPVSCSDGARGEYTVGLSPSSKNERKLSTASNVVTLKVTDESGNVTNTRKLSATPSFITRSTSEKVPNRSQMMSEVQRTAWARHTTK